jgi:hypothetical protein
MCWRRRMVPKMAMVLAALTIVTPRSQVPNPPSPARHGLVRGDRHAFVDDGGEFLPRGASLFWALWGYQHDRARLERNLATVRDWGFDYVRVLGVVGAPGNRPDDSWRDRRLDPTAASYDRDVAMFTDWAYRQYGLRVQWTIFGGTDFTPTPESRRALVARFGAMARGREEELFAFEIANEAWQNGFSGEAGRRELQALARTLKSRSPVLVALSAPEGSSCASARALYRGSAADLLTLHLTRAGAGAIWNSFQELWPFHSCVDVPMLASSNEPVGPESSVASLDDPVALAALALVTYGSGLGAFVMHTGPGVRGGGADDMARGRHSNVWELPTASRISRGLATIVRSVPGDFANWNKQDAMAEGFDRVFDVADRSALAGMYCFTKEPAYACAPFGITRAFQLIPRRNLSVSIRQLVDGTDTPARHLTPGIALTVPAARPAVLLLGRFE